MKTIEDLSGTLNGAGSFANASGVLNAAQWEHPEEAGHFVLITFAYGGLKFKCRSATIAIPFEELFALAKAHEPGLLPVLPAVTADPGEGAHPQNVTLSCSIAGVEIRYTVDGSEPTSGSTLYAGPVNVAAALTLKAKAFKADWQPSPVASFIYT